MQPNIQDITCITVSIMYYINMEELAASIAYGFLGTHHSSLMVPRVFGQKAIAGRPKALKLPYFPYNYDSKNKVRGLFWGSGM